MVRRLATLLLAACVALGAAAPGPVRADCPSGPASVANTGTIVGSNPGTTAGTPPAVAPPAPVRSIAALSPALAAYLSARSSRVGVQVSDLTAHVTYAFLAGHSFITGSSVKVAIMLAFLRQLEAAHRGPTAYERSLLTAMIERSDNTAAGILNERVGDRVGLQRFARALRITGFAPGSVDDRGWGWGTFTPSALASILTLFWQGKVLASTADTRLARTLLSHVISSQQWGVGSTRPPGATVYMKNGWVPGPDGLWVVNSSGIVVTRTRTYVIAIFTAHNASYLQGHDTVVHIAAAVAKALR